MKGIRLLGLLLGLILLVNLTGCNASLNKNILDGEEDNLPAYVEDDIDYEPEYGGEVILPLTTFKTLNPLLNENALYYHFSKLIFEGLFDFDKDLKPIPVLAKDYTILDQGRVINIRLRENVFWHDGGAFTSEDVAFTINTIKFGREDTVYRKMLGNSASIYSGQNINRILNVEILGPYELNIRFDENFSHGLEVLTFPIIPKHKFATHGEGRVAYGQALAEDNYTPIGTGPYKLKVYDKFKTVDLVAFEDYWKGRPYISKVIGKVLENEELVITAFESGQLDLALPLGIDWEKYSQNQRIKIYEFISENYEFLGFNFRHKLFADEKGKELRKALAHGIDRQKIIRNVYLGHGTQAELPIHPDSWLLWEDANIYGYNPTKAQEKLEKLGWKDTNGDGYYEDENGNEITIRLLTSPNNDLRLKAANMIAEDLNKIGIKVIKDYPENLPDNLDDELIERQWEETYEKISKNDFHMVLIGWNLSTIQDLSFAFHSSKIQAGTNFINYEDETMDRLLLEAYRAGSQEEKIKVYERLQSYIVKELPYISLFFRNNALLVDKSIMGPIEPSFFNYYRNIEQWYIPKEFQKGNLE